MRKHRDLLALLIVATFLTLTCLACPPPSLSQKGRVAWTADQVIDRLQDLQAAAIDANRLTDEKTGKPLLSKAATRNVVQFTVAAGKALKETPEGWYASVAAAYAAMKEQLAPEDLKRLEIYLGPVDAVMDAMKPEGGTP